MIVSTKGRYALRVMIDLAEHQAERYVPLKEVAARQDISEKYLENILKVLVQNGFLEGLRGKGGGYRLTRSPDQYTVAEILLLTEGSLAPVSCLTPGAPACERGHLQIELFDGKKPYAVFHILARGLNARVGKYGPLDPTPEYGPPAQIAADADERIRTCILKGSLEPFAVRNCQRKI